MRKNVQNWQQVLDENYLIESRFLLLVNAKNRSENIVKIDVFNQISS